MHLIANQPSPRPFPWLEVEMIDHYGLRRLTSEEQRIFPGLQLVLDMFKARLTKPPSVMPGARSGWVVWVAETYPGHYLVRMPGGASLLAPYHRMEWEVIPDDVSSGGPPPTTLADAKIEEKRRRWQTVVRRSIHQTLQL